MSVTTTPLYKAVKHNQLEAARLLLEHGANPTSEPYYTNVRNVTRAFDEPAVLSMSIKTDDIAMLDLLMDYGINANIMDCINYAQSVRCLRILNDLFSRYISQKPLIIDSSSNINKYLLRDLSGDYLRITCRCEDNDMIARKDRWGVLRLMNDMDKLAPSDVSYIYYRLRPSTRKSVTITISHS